ncbi:MAG: sulfotransferase domain-containing protein [Gammaproteobacteria bacterium]|nr:sulfotransferase domain-containing protein [Gammaproteobacteria bacterium]
MSEQAGIYWLASYPKSGNTWFRIFLAHILNTSGEALDLDSIQTGAIASARGWVDEALGFDSAHLSHDDVDALRPVVYAWHAKQTKKVGYHKIHDAYTYLLDGSALIPTDGCLGVLYFIRNPLDVAISFSNHLNCSIDKAIVAMKTSDFAFCKGHNRQHDQLRQQLLSWSMHVKSWRDAKNMNCLVLRYEDMKLNSVETFTKAVQFLNLKTEPGAIERALNDSDIERLQRLEQENGFKEKPPKTKSFFRKGIVGDWENTLTSNQVNQIIHDHGEMMEAHGYL